MTKSNPVKLPIGHELPDGPVVIPNPPPKPSPAPTPDIKPARRQPPDGPIVTPKKK
jgi:hypothetical protein